MYIPSFRIYIMGSASGATYTNHVRTSENVPFVVKRDFPRCRSQESLRGASTVPGAGPAATAGWAFDVMGWGYRPIL